MPTPTAAEPLDLHLGFDKTVPVLRLPEEANFEAVRNCIREHMPAHAATIAGRSVRLDLGRREIALFDLRRTLHLLKQEFSLEVTGLYVRPEVATRFAERELKLKLFFSDGPSAPSPEEQDTEEMRSAVTADEVAPAVLADETAPPPLAVVSLPHDLTPADIAQVPEIAVSNAPAATPTPPPPRPTEGRRSQTITRTLRSGAMIRFDGDLFVFGDVNPGAHLVATGNIVVLGALKGMAHAGAAGDEEAFIFGFDLRPTQLRIGRKIAIPQDRRADQENSPEIANVIDGNIVIEPYKGRFR